MDEKLIDAELKIKKLEESLEKKSHDTKELLRIILGSLNLKTYFLDGGKTDWYSNLTEKQKKEVMANCASISNKKFFKNLCEDIIGKQMKFTTAEAANMEQVAFGRGTINGISLLYEAIEALASEHRGIKKEEFDKYEVI